MKHSVQAEQDKYLIDSLMKICHKRGLFNGNILVTQNDKVIYQNEFGFTDASKTSKLSPASVFNIGSIAKEFNAVAIMMLVEKGKLNLDDKLSKFELQLPAWSDTVQVKNILNYTSGLPRVNWSSVKNDQDIFSDLKKLKKLKFEPGTNYLYSNNNVFLQRRIIEKVSDMSFTDFAQKHLLTPCEMTNSRIDITKDNPAIVKAFSNDFVDDKWSDIEFSGWVYPTINDMYKWVNNLHSGKLISQESLKVLFDSYSEGAQAALGRGVYEKNELLTHSHHGSSFNYESFNYFNKKDKLSVILMTNNKNRKLKEISRSIEQIIKKQAFSLPQKSVYGAIIAKCTEDAESGIQLYKSLKKKHLQVYNFLNESELNRVGYKLKGNGKIEDAIKIFKLLISEFPNSANPYDSLAEAYFDNNNYDLALLNYKKSLELDPKNANAAEMIEKIQKKK